MSLTEIPWELSSAGRASALQAEGHRFEPYSSHQVSVSDIIGPVVQLVRMPACHAGGRGFEPLPGRQFAQIAQSVEQGTENPCVVGSIPTLGTKKDFCLSEILTCGFNSAVECHLAKVKVASSNLVTRSILKQRTYSCLFQNIWRHSQVVRQKSAKLLFPSSSLGGASKSSQYM